MADMTPPAQGALLAALDLADTAAERTNVLLAYAVTPEDHETHLDVIQDLQVALAALREDVSDL